MNDPIDARADSVQAPEPASVQASEPPPSPRPRSLRRRVEGYLMPRLGVPIVYAIIRLLMKTWRVEHHNPERTGISPAVLAIWHGDLAYGATELPRLFKQAPDSPVDVQVSLSRDGDAITRFVQMWKARAIRGGSSKGATAAMLAMRRCLAENHRVFIAVDGPRGPFSTVKPGAVILASQAQVPIIPGAALTNRAWRFRSWDRLWIPKPFARVRVVLGEPLHVPPDADRDQLEAARAELERRLLEIHQTHGNGIIGAQDGPTGRVKSTQRPTALRRREH